MKKSIYFSAVFFVAIFWASSVFAATWYVDNAANGSNTGTSWTNAWESFPAIHWGSVSAGDTVYISGGSTSKTYTEQLTIGASGSPGTPITITVGQSSPHNGTVILDGGSGKGIYLNGISYVTVSGQLGSSEIPNMIVRNHNDNEITLSGTTGVEIAYLDVGPHLDNAGHHMNDAIDVVNYLGGGNRIHHSKIHMFHDYGIKILPPSGTILNDDHLRIDHNDFYDLGHDAIHAGARAGGLTIDHNKIHYQPDAREGYVDGMHLRGLSYLTIAYNKIYNLEGPDQLWAYIYIEADSSQAANDIYIYNNVIYETEQRYNDQNMGISFGCKHCTSLKNVRIVNNTIVDLENAAIMLGTYDANPVENVVIANNLIYNNNLNDKGTGRVIMGLRVLNAPGGVRVGSYGDSPTPDIIWDYNLVDIYSSGTVKGRFGPGEATTRYDYPGEWNTKCDCGDNDVQGDPIFVNWTEGNAVNLHLSSTDTAAINRGKNLSSDAYLGFNDDFDGNKRMGIWDIGAYESGQSDQTTPSPPSNLKVE